MRLGQWSRAFYLGQRDEIGTDSGFTRQGYLLPAFSEPEVAAARSRIEMQRALGLPVRWLDALPLVGYCLCLGRCRTCGARFSPRYFVVELLTGLCFVGLFYLDVVVNVHDLGLLRREHAAVLAGRVPWQAWVMFVHHALLVCFLLVASFIAFWGVRSTFDPTAKYRASKDAARIIAEKRKELGLDRPILLQWWTWITHFVRGDWGVSSSTNDDVREMVTRALGKEM